MKWIQILIITISFLLAYSTPKILSPEIIPVVIPPKPVEVKPEPIIVPPPPTPRERRLAMLPKIRTCESGGNDFATNPGSSAKGRYQFLDGTWEHYGKKLWGSEWTEKDVFSGKDNQELAEFVAVNFGLSDWEASQHCWG